MMRFWDGRPVNFVCGARSPNNDHSEPPLGEVFFCLAIEVLQDVEEESEGDEDSDAGVEARDDVD